MRAINIDPSDLGTDLGRLAPAIARAGSIAGILGLGASAGLALTGGGMARALQSYLVAFAFFLSLSLGALFFVLLQHLTRAGWSVVVRRLAESIAGNLPLLAVLFIPILLGLREIYPWAGGSATDPGIAAKLKYLNLPFFAVRWGVFFLVWIILARYFWSRSTTQDRTGEVDLTRRMESASAPGMLLFALTLNFAAFDLLMSVDPSWYSTIFGVYYFAGSFLGFLALFSIATPLLQRSGRLRGVTDEHYHDLGKLVFGFTIFWAYIAFSQYMLIWYSNIPEETRFYLIRQQHGWTAVSLLLLFGQFVLPFLYLLPRFVKRRPKLFGPMAAWVLFMHYVDVYWLVMPAVSPNRVPVHLLDLTTAIGIGGLFVAGTAWRLRRTSLVPLRDPRLSESLAFENA